MRFHNIACLVVLALMSNVSLASELHQIKAVGNIENPEIYDSVELTVTGILEDGSDANLSSASIVYASDDTSVATVDSSGNISVLGSGQATINVTATLNGVTHTDDYALDIDDPVLESIMVLSDNTDNDQRVQVANTETSSLSVTGILSSGDDADLSGATIAYSSDNTSIATVDSSGVVTGQGGTGDTYINVSVTLDGTTVDSAIKVNGPVLDSVSGSPSAMFVSVGNTAQISVSGVMSDETSANLSGATITYSSSDTSAATVSASGLVTAQSLDPAVITISVTLDNQTDTTTVSVNSDELESIAISPDPITLSASGTQQLTVTGTMNDSSSANLSAATITYVSDNENVVTVDSNGLLQAVGNGEASVTAMVDLNGSVFDETVEVDVDGYLLYVGRFSELEVEEIVDSQALEEDFILETSYGQLVRSANGDKITYLIDIPEAGDYALSWSGRQDVNGGIAEVKLYSSVMGSYDFYADSPSDFHQQIKLKNLTAGAKKVSFEVTGKNSNSSDYHLYLKEFALVKLDTQDFQSLLLTDSNITPEDNNDDVKVLATTTGKYVEYDFELPTSDDYELKLYFEKKSNGGIADISLQGDFIGSFDFYASDNTNHLETFVIETKGSGTKTLRLETVGKNASSSNYYMYLKKIALVKLTQADNVKDLVVSDQTSGITVLEYSYGEQVRTDVGEFIEYEFDVPEDGTYELKYFGRKYTGGGQHDIYLDGVKVNEFDHYAPVQVDEVITVGMFDFKEGETYRLKLQCTGKDAASGNEHAYVRWIGVVK